VPNNDVKVTFNKETKFIKLTVMKSTTSYAYKLYYIDFLCDVAKIIVYIKFEYIYKY